MNSRITALAMEKCLSSGCRWCFRMELLNHWMLPLIGLVAMDLKDNYPVMYQELSFAVFQKLRVKKCCSKIVNCKVLVTDSMPEDSVNGLYPTDNSAILRSMGNRSQVAKHGYHCKIRVPGVRTHGDDESCVMMSSDVEAGLTQW